jgi:allophanate hydrolase subunit 1|tara:strand:- start:1176 stop:1352 length:177 start_codon:yes stop_codon:yes gene_type:complete
VLPYEECKKILNSGIRKFNDQQLNQIIELVQGMAELSVELYLKQIEDEKCSNNVKGKQ